MNMNIGAALRVLTLRASVESDLPLSVEENEALKAVLGEIGRYRDALQFYANPETYLDDDPGTYNDEGDFTPDGGNRARDSLRLDDTPYSPLTPLEVEAIQTERKAA